MKQASPLNPNAGQEPALPAQLDASKNPPLAALMDDLARSQWWSAQELLAWQLRKLRELLLHHEMHSPWMRERLRHKGSSAHALSASMLAFAEFPLTSRRDLQTAGDDFHSQFVPATQQPVFIKKSSGSTGEPVVVRRTAASHLFWLATTLREHLWHRRSANASLVAVRANLAQAMASNHWGPPVGDFFETGPSYGIPSNTDVAALVELLKQSAPNYLLIYPSIWRAVLDLVQAQGTRSIMAPLRQVRTLGETVTGELRARTQAEAGVALVDMYSAEEVGTLAVECPESGLYHTMAEGLLVEVLAQDGSACQVGEVGRVVVTDLLNLASPLVRYECGDYAEVGPTCSCGRGLPTLKRILGRERNMVRLPDGRRYWPTTGFRDFATVADIRQYQFVQKSLQTIEVRLVVAIALTATQEEALSDIISRWMGHTFEYRFVYFADRIARHKSGKFEEFICEV